MFKKDKSVYDKFSFSLGGMTTITSFTAAPAIAHDRLHQEQVDSGQKQSPKAGWSLFRRMRRSQAAC